MEKRSECGSGGCDTCPFSCNELTEQVYNYGCLPDQSDIYRMKEISGHNWACHSDENVICGGFVKDAREYRPDLNMKVGNLISYHTWYHDGEKIALAKAKQRNTIVRKHH